MCQSVPVSIHRYQEGGYDVVWYGVVWCGVV